MGRPYSVYRYLISFILGFFLFQGAAAESPLALSVKTLLAGQHYVEAEDLLAHRLQSAPRDNEAIYLSMVSGPC